MVQHIAECEIWFTVYSFYKILLHLLFLTFYTEWRQKNRPAVSYTNVGVGLGLCTGN